MPSASLRQGRPVASPRGRVQGRDRAGGARARGAGARVRWDRLGGAALLLVGTALLYLYLSAGIRMLSTWSQARYDNATLAALEREHLQLERQHEALGRRGSVEDAARQLGMVKQGEQSYIVTGLPDN